MGAPLASSLSVITFTSYRRKIWLLYLLSLLREIAIVAVTLTLKLVYKKLHLHVHWLYLMELHVYVTLFAISIQMLTLVFSSIEFKNNCPVLLLKAIFRH